MSLPSIAASIKHVAISTDGNGRWATRRGLPRSAGHAASTAAFESVLAEASKCGLQFLSLHVFSTENWDRPKDEVRKLIELFTRVLNDAESLCLRLNVRFLFCGSRRDLPFPLLEAIVRLEKVTSSYSGLTLVFCLNYGGRQELLDAANLLADEIRTGVRRSETVRVTEEQWRSYFYLPDLPDVDLYIRTGGRMRFSNFMLWQCAYAEVVFADILWPDFRGEDLRRFIGDYRARTRTFGALPGEPPD